MSGMGNGGPDDNDAQANRIVAVPLTSGGHPNSNAPGRRKEDDANLVAFHPTGGGEKGLSESEGVAPGTGTGRAGAVAVALTAKGKQGDQENYVTFTARGRADGTQIEVQDDGVHPALRSGRAGGRRDSGIAGTLRSHVWPGSNASSEVVEGQIVRRLMPVECERLQGFPDGWTDLGDTADTPRYSAMGDAVTVNVAEWIGGRL